MENVKISNYGYVAQQDEHESSKFADAGSKLFVKFRIVDIGSKLTVILVNQNNNLSFFESTEKFTYGKIRLVAFDHLSKS
jgi:hypothetical protein